MEENGIHLQINIPNSNIQNLKDPNSIIDLHLKKERVDRIDQGDFLLQNNVDFSQLTFFHPGELDESENSADTSIKNGIENLNSDSTDFLLSESSLREISDVVVQAPLETTTAFQDTSFLPATNENVSLNITNIQENAMNLSYSSNSSVSEWSAEEIGAVFIVCLMVPFIICSNLFVILSVIKFRRLHTPTNYFITSLAAVDIVVALATPLAIAVQLFQYGGGDAAHDTVLCLLPNRILMMACGVSLLTLATIAYDRHTALINPLEYVNIMTSRKVAIMMTVSWLYSSVVVWIPIAAGWYDILSPSVRCSSDHLHPNVHILFFTAVFIPSCTVIMICYTRIFLVARHHANAIAAVEFAVHRRLQARFIIKDTKYAKTLALVIGAFLLLWLPHLIYTFLKTFGEISINTWLETYLILLAILNSGLNPWIYAFKNNEFRAAFKRMAKEYCGYNIFKIDDRRGSLMSGTSITPRLSRTDSRMVSTILEPTADSQIREKIWRSLDSLDDYEIEEEQTKYRLSESEARESKTAIPGMILINEITPQSETNEGHINWGHDDDEYDIPTEDTGNTEYFRKNSGTNISRNQSFTLGLHHVCCDNIIQKSYNEQQCNCRRSNPVVSHKLTRSTTSVSPSSTRPYSINLRTGEPNLPFPVNFSQSSGLSFPSSSIQAHSLNSNSLFPSSIENPSSTPVTILNRNKRSYEHLAHMPWPI